jgi:hypothetical protein
MNLQGSKNRITTILALLVSVNIVGDIGNIAIWWANAESRAASLNTGIIANLAGIENALLAGTIILSVVAIAYTVALFGLIKKVTWAPYLIIAISVSNRVLALFLYFISAAFAFWAVWTAVLLIVSYLHIRRTKALMSM